MGRQHRQKPHVWRLEVTFRKAAGTPIHQGIEQVFTCRHCGMPVSKKAGKNRVWEIDGWCHKRCTEGDLPENRHPSRPRDFS